MKTLIIDVSRCNGCYNCQISCKDEHVGNDWTPYAKPQPDVGQFWIKVNETVRGSVPKVKVSYVPIVCMHCDNAPCIKACPISAIQKRKDGIVLIDPEKCDGCRNCIDKCPYKTIYFNSDLNIAQKCTMCAHLLDNGWKEPRCVDVCPTGALKFGEESDFKALLANAEIMKPENDTKPRVYYIGLPKRFIAGAVYDPEKEECIENATVTVTYEKTGENYKTTTDNYGNFWIEKLPVGTFEVTIEKTGYQPAKIKSVSTKKDINIGDIKLHNK